MASKSSVQRKYGPKPPAELNLGPIMNLMVVLIPMLLYSAQFIKFSALNVTKAANSSSAINQPTPTEKPKPPLKLKLKISSEEGFILEGAFVFDEEKVIATPGGEGAAAGELATVELKEDLVEKTLSKVRKDYADRGQPMPADIEQNIRTVYKFDFIALNKKIDLIRQAVNNGGGADTFEKVDQIMIACEGELPFELLVQTMDSVRCKYNTDTKKFYACKPKTDAGKEDPNTLYENVILDANILE